MNVASLFTSRYDALDFINAHDIYIDIALMIISIGEVKVRNKHIYRSFFCFLLAFIAFSCDSPYEPASTLTIETSSLQKALIREEYSYNLYASGGDFTYAWSASGLPDWLSINKDGRLSGTPTATGTVQFKVTVTDGAGAAVTKDLSLSVAEGFIIEDSNRSTWAANREWNSSLDIDGSVATVKWSVVSGSLPPGITLAESGFFYGASEAIGTHRCTIRATDAKIPARYAEKDFSFTIEPYEWTVMVYIDGDNDLEPYAMKDLNEMESVNLGGTGMKVIALIDGCEDGYYTGSDAFKGTRLYEVQYDASGAGVETGIVSKRLSMPTLGLTALGGDEEELNLGDPAVARDFIDDCKASFPAKNYTIIFWNHGSGWRSYAARERPVTEGSTSLALGSPVLEGYELKPTTGQGGIQKAICFDDGSKDCLFTHELGVILEGKGISVVCLDLCYGAMIEIAYEIRDHAKYLVASEEVSPGDGYNYRSLFDHLKSKRQYGEMSEIDFCKQVLIHYSKEYSNLGGTTQSVIELGKIANVKSALDSLSMALSSAIDTEAKRTEILNVIFSKTEDFYSVPGDLNVDLSDLAYQLRYRLDYVDAQASALGAAVSEAVIANYRSSSTSGNSNLSASGLSIHFSSLDNEGKIKGHDVAYDKAYTGAHPLAFVQDSAWSVDSSRKDGFLYRLFYDDTIQ